MNEDSTQHWPPKMRKRTSLIPLSIHEDNAFDGIEIAIKPSLFSSPSNDKASSNDSVTNSISNTISSRTSNRIVSTPHELNDFYDNKSSYSSNLFNFYNYSTSSQTFHDALNSPKVFTDNNIRTQPYSGINLNNEFQNGNMNKSKSNQISMSGLEPGDLIEIRVWDEKVSDISETYRTYIEKFPLEYKLQPKQQKDDLHETKEQVTQKTNQEEVKKPKKQTESKIESYLSRENSSDDNTSTTYFPLLSPSKQNEVTKNILPGNSMISNQSRNISQSTKFNLCNNDTKHLHQSSPQELNCPTNSGTKMPTENTPPKSKLRPFLPFGVEIADHAIKNSPNTSRRGVSSPSPCSPMPELSFDSILKETNSKAPGFTDSRPNNSMNHRDHQTSITVKEDYDDCSDDVLSSSHKLRLYFVMRVNQKSLVAIKETARTKISLKRQGV